MHGLVEHSSVARPTIVRRFLKRVRTTVAKKRTLRALLVVSNLVLLVVIGGLVWHGAQSEQVLTGANAIGRANDKNNAEPLDQISSADIAVNAARALGLAETTAVNNQADSVAASLAVSPADTTVIAKPQAVATTSFSRKDIKNYVVVPGDTVASIAAKFGVTSDSIIWSNNLNGNSVNAGVKLVIPPSNGIVYIVKKDDTVDSLAAKYRANKDQIIAVNDIELTGLRQGEQILIPNGQQPAAIVFTRAAAVYGPYNGYDYGFCTWYVADRRAKVGSPLPSNLGNASTWDDRAAGMGILVTKTPAVGTAVVTSQRGAGHVAYVEAVNADGSIWVSEMNSYGQVSMNDTTPRGGWGVVDWKLISASAAASYNYVH
jgi:surface antigen